MVRLCKCVFILMNEMAAAALFTVLADENVMIPAAKWGHCSSNYTRAQLKKMQYTVNTIYQETKCIQEKIQKIVKPYKRNENSITLLNFIHHVFTTSVKWLISQNPNEALINCVCMRSN